MPIRKISQAEAAENKKKQQVLRTAGYNIKVDGSWGPWQEKQYRKVTSAKRGKTSQANVGVMALPVAGYGIAQLLEGLGSMSLPSISLPFIPASAAAMAAPVALTLAGPAYGLYETITGQHHQVNITPQERQAMTYAPDATRVSRPIVVSRTRVGSQSQSRPIGEMYINPALTRTRSVSMASEAARDSTGTATAPRYSTGTVPSSAPQGNKPEDKKPKQDPKKKGGFKGGAKKPKQDPKKKGGFKGGAKRVGRNLGNFYGKVLTGGAYGVGGVGVPGAIGYGIYRWSQPEPTVADSLLEEQSRQIMELGKLGRARQNQITIDSLRRSLSNPVQSTGDTLRAGTASQTPQQPVEEVSIIKNNPFMQK